LNEFFSTDLFRWIVPDLAFVYSSAIMVCLLVFARRSKAAGLPEADAWGAALCGAGAGIIGIRLWYLVLHPALVIEHPVMLLDLNGPTVSFGGYLLGTLAFVLFLHARNASILPFLDVAASCLGLGPMIARWACFLNGDDYGTVTTIPWGVAYPPGSYPFVDHVNRGLINLMADNSLPVHPVQIYLSLKGLLLFVICSWLWKKRAFPPGVLFGVFWLLYALLRFGLEFFRGDAVDKVFGLFTPGQVACACIFLTAAFWTRKTATKSEFNICR
jgi:phosphatidylglycerol:prolipoprotein diacylglycerol transferase